MIALVGIALLVLALPTVLAIIHLAAASRLRQLAVVVGIGLAVYVLLGNFQGLAIAIFELHLVVPIDRRAALFNHQLRSQQDASNLVRQLELGRLNR